MSGSACKMAYEQPKHEGRKLGTVEENPALLGLQLQTVTEKNYLVLYLTLITLCKIDVGKKPEFFSGDFEKRISAGFFGLFH